MMKVNENGITREMTEEEMTRYRELETVDVNTEINALKEELATYDYIGVKIAMQVATVKDYAKEIAYTETLRAKIRELEKQLS